MPFDYIFWDNDGVLVDTERLYDVERLRPRYSGLLGRPLMLGNSVDVLDNPYA